MTQIVYSGTRYSPTSSGEDSTRVYGAGPREPTHRLRSEEHARAPSSLELYLQMYGATLVKRFAG